MVEQKSNEAFILWGAAAACAVGLVDAIAGIMKWSGPVDPVTVIVLLTVSAFSLVVFGVILGLGIRFITGFRPVFEKHLGTGGVLRNPPAVIIAVLSLAVAVLGASALMRHRGIQLEAIDFSPAYLSAFYVVVCTLGGTWLRPVQKSPRTISIILAALSILTLGISAGALGRFDPALEILTTRTVALKPFFRGIQNILDRDADGFPSLMCSRNCDCADTDPGINPAAVDLPGNGIDEDCSGKDFILSDKSVALRSAKDTGRILSAGLNTPYNILLISIDAMRADHMKSYGYDLVTTPAIDRFAERNVRFHQVRSQSSSTRFVFPVLLTGKYFSTLHLEKGKKWYRLLGSNVTFSERLREKGYSTRAVLQYFRFQGRSGFGQGFDEWTHNLDSERDPTWDPTADLVTTAGMAHLAGLQESRAPWLLWLHYFDPHAAYVKHDNQPSFGTGRVARYDGELYYTDRHFQQIMDALNAGPAADRTVVIVLSDHGEGHGRVKDHGLNYHGFSLFDSEIRVPLIMRVPGVGPRVVSESVALMDIVPTMLELAGIRPDASIHGRSLVPYITGKNPDRGPFLSELPTDSPQMALIDWPYKLIWKMRVNRYLLFNLLNDQDEQQNLSAEKPEVVKELRDTLRMKRLEMMK